METRLADLETATRDSNLICGALLIHVDTKQQNALG